MKARTIAVGLLAAACLTGCGRQPASAQQNGGTGQAAPAAQTTQAAYADTALVGNSYIESFFTYDALPGAACFYRVGLNVNSVFEQPMLQGEDTQTPVIGLLEGRDFANIVFFFGENELGWSNRQAFTEQYGRVLDAAPAACPDAESELSLFHHRTCVDGSTPAPLQRNSFTGQRRLIYHRPSGLDCAVKGNHAAHM